MKRKLCGGLLALVSTLILPGRHLQAAEITVDHHGNVQITGDTPDKNGGAAYFRMQHSGGEATPWKFYDKAGVDALIGEIRTTTSNESQQLATSLRTELSRGLTSAADRAMERLNHIPEDLLKEDVLKALKEEILVAVKEAIWKEHEAKLTAKIKKEILEELGHQ
jgi:hypothetical protein